MIATRTSQTPKNRPIAQSRAEAEIPEIFVKTSDGIRSSYARAHIRVKSGKYNYLVWRDGDQIRNFYLGKKRET